VVAIDERIRQVRVIVGLARALHPLPAFAVTALATAVTAALGAGAGTQGLVALSTAAGQASVGWSNDYLDRGRDAAAERIDKPIVAGDVSPAVVWSAALLAFAVCLALSLPLGLPETGVMAVAVASAWLYNAGLKATVLSWLPYAVSFGLAPVYIWVAATGRVSPWWVAIGAGVLGVAAHLLNVIPDLETDAATTVRGLPHRLELRSSLLVACILFASVLSLVLIAGDSPGFPATLAAALAAALILGVAWGGLTGRGRLGFRLAVGVAAAIVAVLVLLPGDLPR
jgi:4-hydroxybenzoate polyprenyltransferase